MLRMSSVLREVNVTQKPLLFNIDFTAKHVPGCLYFADRAVKSTSSEPLFVCLDNVLACQSRDSNAAAVVRSCSSREHGVVQHGCLRFQGPAAAFVFRQQRLMFQCRGDTTIQTHELTLLHSDVFALLSLVPPVEQLQSWVRSVEAAIKEGDVEYVAEEMLLQLRGVQEGCTSLVARVSKFSKGMPAPPESSHAF